MAFSQLLILLSFDFDVSEKQYSLTLAPSWWALGLVETLQPQTPPSRADTAQGSLSFSHSPSRKVDVSSPSHGSMQGYSFQI